MVVVAVNSSAACQRWVNVVFFAREVCCAARRAEHEPSARPRRCVAGAVGDTDTHSIDSGVVARIERQRRARLSSTVAGVARHEKKGNGMAGSARRALWRLSPSTQRRLHTVTHLVVLFPCLSFCRCLRFLVVPPSNIYSCIDV